VAISGQAHAQSACESLKGLQLPDVRITGASAQATPAPLCKLDGVIGKEVNFTLWLPEAWNGKFIMGGQGGFAGTVDSQPLQMGVLQRGYALAGTDTGHVVQGGGTDGSWAMGDLERVVNYAHGAIHSVTEVSKAVIRTRYGRVADRSYFVGCSNGGREALMSAQRYPNDFDGIVAGAPALDFQGAMATFLTVTRKMYPDPKRLDEPVLNKPARDLLAAKVLEKCDSQDGLKDGVLSKPLSCDFDVRTLACKKGKSDGCLTEAQVDAVQTIRNGPMLNGKPFHVGFPYGGESNEAGWGRWLAGKKDGIAKDVPSAGYGFSLDFMRYFVKQDPTWSYTSFTPAALVSFPKEMSALQKTISANDPDLSAFRSKGGKLLMYHGWADSALSPNMSIRYVDSVYAHDASAKNDVRLFLLPGVLHCGGGPGPDRFDSVDLLDKWISGAPAPEEAIASFASGGSRKVCAYPKVQVFNGAGDGKSPEQFSCKAPG
jgi:feruloyl esterase